MRFRTFALAVLAGGMVAASAAAEPVPALDVPKLAEAADLIVVGRADKVALESNASGAGQTFVVSVERTLKDTSAESRHRIQVRLARSRAGAVAMRNGRYGIFFLRRVAPRASYEVIDAYRPLLPALPGSAVARRSAPDGLADIAQELTSVLATPPAELAAKQRIANDSAGPPADRVQAIYHAAAAALATLPYETAGPALSSVADAGAMPGRLWAIASLFSMRGPAEIEALKTKGLESVAPLLVDPPPELEPAAYALSLAMEGRIDAPQAVPALATLLRSRMVEVRRAAASVLSDIATPEVIAPLATLALYDSDWDVRYFAVLGLAEASGAERIPTVAAFQEREKEMLRRWRSWASANVR